MTDTNHTDSVEASEKEYQRQLAIAISVGEKEPHISAFIGAWDMYDGLMNDCFMTSKDRAQMRKMLTTLQAHTSQQVENWHKESFDRGLELGQQQVEEAVRKERERIISLAGGEPYIYVPNITEANSDTK